MSAGKPDLPETAPGASPAPDTALERWKTLARAENAAARRLWGNSGWTDRGTRPKTPKEMEVEARQRRRVERIERWHGAGVDIEEIARRLGVRPGTIQAILREQRRAAQRRAAAEDG